jgi:hypothetical protein
MGLFDVFSGKNDRKAAMIAAQTARDIQNQIQAALQLGQEQGIGAVNEATPLALGAIDDYEPIAQGYLTEGRDSALGSLNEYGAKSIGAINDAEPRMIGSLEKGYGLARDVVGAGTERALSYYKPFVDGGLKSYGMLHNSMGLNGAGGNAAAEGAYKESAGTKVAINRANEEARRSASAMGQLGGGNAMAEIADRTQENSQLGMDKWQDRLERDTDRGVAASGASAGLIERSSNTIGGYHASEGKDVAGVIGDLGKTRAGIYDGIGSRSASINDGWGRGAAAITADAGQRRSSIHENVGKTKANIYTGTASQIGSSIGDLGKQLVAGTYKAFDGADNANANQWGALMGIADLGVKFGTGMWGVPKTGKA